MCEIFRSAIAYLSKIYETDAAKRTSIKYLYMLEKLEQYGFVDEDHGILSIQKIKMCVPMYLQIMI